MNLSDIILDLIIRAYDGRDFAFALNDYNIYFLTVYYKDISIKNGIDWADGSILIYIMRNDRIIYNFRYETENIENITNYYAICAQETAYYIEFIA